MPVNNPSGGGGDHVAHLEESSRDGNSPITDYPVGLSLMPGYKNDGGWPGSAGQVFVRTSYFNVFDAVSGWQEFYSYSSDEWFYRSWEINADEWVGWVELNNYDALVNKPSTFPPQIAGTPSEGDVVTYVSGVPTWAAP